MLLNVSDLWTSFPQWIHSASVHVLSLGFLFFWKLLFKERATYLSSANNTEFVFCFQSSIQWVLWWCKWLDSGTIQEDQWVSKCLLGMGWRRWWSLEQVSVQCLCLSHSSVVFHLWEQLGVFSVSCYLLKIFFKWKNSNISKEHTFWRDKLDILFSWPGDS